MNCILCGKRKLKVLTKKLRNNEPGVVRYCPECDFGILEDKIGSDELRYWYNTIYRQGRKLLPAGLYLEYQEKRIDLLKPFLNKNVRLLDIGCSVGHFIMAVKDHVEEVVGIDYDKNAVYNARRWTGCTVLDGELEESLLEEESFDVVTVIHVLEHTYDPIQFLGVARRYVKPGGILYVEVPNMNDAINVVYGSEGFKDVLFHRAHRWYFTPKSLAKIMEKAGFSGISVSLNMYNVLNHLSWVLADESIDAMGEPVLPIVEDVSKDIRQDLQKWIIDTDVAYKNILLRHGVSGEVGFIGHAS